MKYQRPRRNKLCAVEVLSRSRLYEAEGASHLAGEGIQEQSVRRTGQTKEDATQGRRKRDSLEEGRGKDHIGEAGATTSGKVRPHQGTSDHVKEASVTYFSTDL